MFRLPLFEALVARFAGRLGIWAGAAYFDETISVAAKDTLPWTPVRNHFFVGRRLLWQVGAWRSAVGAAVVVCELNPRVLSTWAVLLSRRFVKRPTVVWGHAWPRCGRRSRTDRMRHLMRLLSDAVLVYTATEAKELRERMPGRTIVAAPNALYGLADRPTSVGRGRMRDLVFVGRLVEAKRPSLLLDAFVRAAGDLPAETNLVFVGEGPLREALEATASRSRHRGRIHFRGELHQPEELALVYADALASVSPGYVGLSLIQSLWFGVPSLIARDEPHSPEIEAAVEGQNAIFFDSGSSDALRAAMLKLVRDRELWIGRRPAIARACAESYSLESTVASFAAAVEAVLG